MHKLKVGQAVIPQHQRPDRAEVYEVVRPLPALPNEELQYRIKARDSGVGRVVREAEIKPLFE